MPTMKDTFNAGKTHPVKGVDKGILAAIHSIMNQDVPDEILSRPHVHDFYEDVYKKLNSSASGPFDLQVPSDPDFAGEVQSSSEVHDEDYNSDVGNDYEYSEGRPISIDDVVSDLELEG